MKQHFRFDTYSDLQFEFKRDLRLNSVSDIKQDIKSNDEERANNPVILHFYHWKDGFHIYPNTFATELDQQHTARQSKVKVIKTTSHFPRKAQFHAFDAALISDYPEEQEWLIGCCYTRMMNSEWTKNNGLDLYHFISALIQIHYGSNTKTAPFDITFSNKAIGIILYRYFKIIDLDSVNIIDMARALIPKLPNGHRVDMNKVADIIRHNANCGQHMNPGPFWKEQSITLLVLLLYLTHTMTTLFLLSSAQQCSFAPITPSSLSYNNPRERTFSDDINAGSKHGYYKKIHATIHRPTTNHIQCQPIQFEHESKEQLPIHPVDEFVRMLDEHGIHIQYEHKQHLVALWTDNGSDRNQFISSLIQIYYGQNTKALLLNTTLPEEAIGLILYRYFNVIDLNTTNVIEMASVLIPKLAIDCQVDMDKVSDITRQNAISGRLFVNGTAEYMKPGPFTKLFESLDNWKKTKKVFERFWKEMNEWVGGADNITNHSPSSIGPVLQFWFTLFVHVLCTFTP